MTGIKNMSFHISFEAAYRAYKKSRHTIQMTNKWQYTTFHLTNGKMFIGILIIGYLYCLTSFL